MLKFNDKFTIGSCIILCTPKFRLCPFYSRSHVFRLQCGWFIHTDYWLTVTCVRSDAAPSDWRWCAVARVPPYVATCKFHAIPYPNCWSLDQRVSLPNLRTGGLLPLSTLRRLLLPAASVKIIPTFTMWVFPMQISFWYFNPVISLKLLLPRYG